MIFGTNLIQRTWSASKEAAEVATRGYGVLTPIGRAPCLVGPSGVHRRTSSSYINQRTPKTSRSTRNTISTAVTFCIREISSWSLRWHSAGEGINHRGLLHQHPCPSDGAPEKAPRWDLTGTKGCGGGNRVSWCSWMFSGYVGIYRRK